jgi:Zn-finger domain-containing protein
VLSSHRQCRHTVHCSVYKQGELTERSVLQERCDEYEKVKGDQRKAARAAELLRQRSEAELQEVRVLTGNRITC